MVGFLLGNLIYDLILIKYEINLKRLNTYLIKEKNRQAKRAEINFQLFLTPTNQFYFKNQSVIKKRIG